MTIDRQKIWAAFPAAVAVANAIGLACVVAFFVWGHQPAPTPPPPPPIALPDTAKGEPGRIVPIEAATIGTEVRWWVADGADLVVKDSKRAYFVSPTPGTYRVLAWTALKGVATDAAQCLVTVGTPTPPVPPVPPVPPQPPTPIPGQGLRVLVVYETSELGKMPAEQRTIITSTAVRSYLDSRCAKGPDGKTPEYRFWDKDVDASKESELWRNVLARPRPSLPWVVIGNTVSGFEGPLPKNVDDMLALLKKYGG